MHVTTNKLPKHIATKSLTSPGQPMPTQSEGIRKPHANPTEPTDRTKPNQTQTNRHQWESTGKQTEPRNQTKPKPSETIGNQKAKQTEPRNQTKPNQAPNQAKGNETWTRSRTRCSPTLVNYIIINRGGQASWTSPREAFLLEF